MEETILQFLTQNGMNENEASETVSHVKLTNLEQFLITLE